MRVGAGVALRDLAEDLEEHRAVVVVLEDRRVVVPLRAHVVIRAGLEMSVRAAHAFERSGDDVHGTCAASSRCTYATHPTRARHVTGHDGSWPPSQVDAAS